MLAKRLITAATAVITIYVFPLSQCADKSSCQKLDEAYTNGEINRTNVYIYGRERSVIVYWDGRETSHAAAALLAAVLRYGLRYRRLRVEKTYSTICQLAIDMQSNCTEYDQSDTILNELFLIPAIGWKECQCQEMEICQKRPIVPLRLRIAGGGAAPLRRRMHVVLSAASRNKTLCQNATSWDFYKDRDALVECDFSSANETNPLATMWYSNSTLDGKTAWNTLSGRQNQNYLQEISVPSDKDLYRQVLNIIKSQNVSVLFLDYDIWGNVPDIQLVQPPTCIERNCRNELDTIRSVRVADIVLQQFAPQILKAFEQFSPSATQLQEVIRLGMNPGTDIEEAACEFALNNPIVFKSWFQRLSLQRHYWIAVFLCNDDPDKDNYKIIARRIEEFYKKATPYFIEVNCSSESDLTIKFLRATMLNDWSSLIGAIGAGAGTKMAAEYATKMETALAIYDLPSAGLRLSAAVHAAIGTIDQLVVAIKHFIFLHKWKRLVVFSEETELATDLLRALQRDKNLIIRDIRLSINVNIKRKLLSLKKSNARIFLLNSVSDVSKEILCSAQELKMTSSNGYIWILREWRVKNLKCANSLNLDQTTHFTISYWWQGQNDARLYIENSDTTHTKSFFNDNFKNLNDSQFLLPFTASIADAMKIVLKKFDIYKNVFPDRLFDIHGNNSQRLVMNSLELEYFSGVLQEQNFIYGAPAKPTVFITHWNGSRPMFLTTWAIVKEKIEKLHEDEGIFQMRTTSDGTFYCLTGLTGDPFDPACHDFLWLAIGGFLVIIVILLCMCLKKRLTKLAYHDSILRAQLLAKEDETSTALGNHLIDRGGLEICHELSRTSFSIVRYGILRAPGRLPITVAVKELRKNEDIEESDLLHEAVTLASLQHPHIVRLIGVCTTDGPLLVLTQYAFFGNLLDYLSERKHFVENFDNCVDTINEAFHVSARSLTRLAKEAVAALEYLSLHRLVHRDIRAANCLIDEQRSLKLADFGLARTAVTVASGRDEVPPVYLSRRRGLFAIRWMAPESLGSGVFTTASDVWALGVLLLEITTLGSRPYGYTPLFEVKNYVCSGGHPPLPSNILPDMQELLLRCWQVLPEMRPTATEIAHSLERNSSMLRPSSLRSMNPILEEDFQETE